MTAGLTNGKLGPGNLYCAAKISGNHISDRITIALGKHGSPNAAKRYAAPVRESPAVTIKPTILQAGTSGYSSPNIALLPNDSTTPANPFELRTSMADALRPWKSTP